MNLTDPLTTSFTVGICITTCYTPTKLFLLLLAIALRSGPGVNHVLIKTLPAQQGLCILQNYVTKRGVIYGVGWASKVAVWAQKASTK